MSEVRSEMIRAIENNNKDEVFRLACMMDQKRKHLIVSLYHLVRSYCCQSVIREIKDRGEEPDFPALLARFQQHKAEIAKKPKPSRNPFAQYFKK
jgi:hypothetical protein